MNSITSLHFQIDKQTDDLFTLFRNKQTADLFTFFKNKQIPSLFIISNVNKQLICLQFQK